MNTSGQLDAYSEVIAIDLPKVSEIALWYDQNSQFLSLANEAATLKTGFQLSIYSLDGKLVRQYQSSSFGIFEQRLDIPLQGLNEGMYVAQLRTEGQTVVKRFVVP